MKILRDVERKEGDAESKPKVGKPVEDAETVKEADKSSNGLSPGDEGASTNDSPKSTNPQPHGMDESLAVARRILLSQRNPTSKTP